MDPVGTAALCAAAISSTVVALRRRRSGGAELVVVASWALALGTWMVRLVTVDLRLAEVAALTRREVPAPLRLAGGWAGPAGSLLLWCALVVAVLVLATRPGAQRSSGDRSPEERSSEERATEPPRSTRRVVGAASAVGAVGLLTLSRPFDRLAEAPLVGAGLNPVLEHPMMLIHPPLLYAAQACVLAAALVGSRPDPDRSRSGVRTRWTLAATALLVTATILGSWWAHDELGWGGWWAWDPVENSALAPLVCLIASLHARTEAVAARWRLAAAAVVLAGVALTRSGLPDSVHAFAPSADVAIVLAAAAALVLVQLARTWGDATPPTAAPGRRSRFAATISAWVTGVGAGWTLTVIGAAGIAAAWLGTRDPVGAIDGRLLGPMLAPVGVGTVAAIVVAGFRRGQRTASMLAHAGVVVFAFGVVGSLATTTEVATVDVGSTTTMDGRRVRLVDARIVEPRADVVELQVTATIDGRRVVASILEHPDLGRTRARPGRLLDATGETELVVSVFSEDRARVELRRHPGLPYLWLGGALCVIGIVWSALVTRPPQSSERRRRLAASNESSAELSSSASGGAGAAGVDPAVGTGAAPEAGVD